MKHIKGYNDLLLKSFIRESFYKYNNKNLFETKRKNNISKIDELDEIGKFLENLAEESLKIEESKRRKSIKFLLEDDTQIFNPDGSLYAPPAIKKNKNKFREWAKNNKVKVFGTVLCAIMLNLVASTVGDGGIDPNTTNQGNFEAGIELASDNLNPEDLDLPEEVPSKTFNELKREAEKQLKKEKNPVEATKKIKKVKKKIKKAKIEKPKAPTPEQAPAIQELEEQEERVEQLEAEVDKKMVELEKELEEGAKKYGDISKAELEGGISEGEFRRVLRISKKNIDKAKHWVNQRNQDEDLDADSFKETQQEEIARSMSNWIKSHIQSQILEGDLADDLRSEDKKGTVKLKQTQSVEGQIDDSTYSGDPLAVVAERLGTLSYNVDNLLAPDMDDSDDYEEMLKDQLKDPSVGKSILKAFKEAGFSKNEAESKLDDIIRKTAKECPKVLTAFINAVNKGEKLRLRRVPKYDPLANPTIRSGSATNQSI